MLPENNGAPMEIRARVNDVIGSFGKQSYPLFLAATHRREGEEERNVERKRVVRLDDYWPE